MEVQIICEEYVRQGGEQLEPTPKYRTVYQHSLRDRLTGDEHAHANAGGDGRKSRRVDGFVRVTGGVESPHRSVRTFLPQ